MEKKAHQLKAHQKTEIPNEFIFFDTEANLIDNEDKTETIHTLKIGWCCYWRRDRDKTIWHYFETIESFWTFVFSRVTNNRKVFLIAHNISYDLLIVNTYYYLPQHNWKLDNFWEENGAHISSWVIPKKYKNKSGDEKEGILKKIVCIDNMNYFKSSLRQLGKDIGHDKGEVDFKTATKEELSFYCKNDVQVMLIAWQEWLKFHKSYNMGKFGMTIAGQSFNTFKHRFMPCDIFIHDNEESYQLERSGYYGGRCEVFRIGEIKDKTYILDVNSMYPAVMESEYYPTSLAAYMENITIEEITIIINKGYLVTCECEIETDKRIFPFRFNKKLVFPVGKFTTTLNTPEVIEGIKKGYIKKVKKISVYNKSKIFTEYVLLFFNERLKAKKNNNGVYILFFKLLLNSLYGKFGQTVTGWDKIGDTEELNPKKWTEYDMDTGERLNYRRFGGIIQVSQKEVHESFDSFPAISGHVTSYARMKLYQYMEIVGFENLFYCDTDSLFVNETGYQNIKSAGCLDENILGMLKLEETCQGGIIYGAKDYKFGKKTKTKGIKKDSKVIEQIGKQITVEQWKWKKTASLIADGDIQTYKMVKQKKTLKREYTKGIVTPSGLIDPFKMGE